MFGLKQRSTYEEIIKHVKSQEERRVSLPNRVASIIHNSIKYQSFINEHLNDLEEQGNKAFKHNILQNEIKQQKGVGNHQVNKSTNTTNTEYYNIGDDDKETNLSNLVNDYVNELGDKIQKQIKETKPKFNKSIESKIFEKTSRRRHCISGSR